jgi:hypothetical protein
MNRLLIYVLLPWFLIVPAYALTGDAQRGEKLHAKCLNCHGTGLYAPEHRKIKSLKALRKDVKRWGTYYAPALTEQEVEDLTTWLNETFYKF